jgi:hypothetical protein
VDTDGSGRQARLRRWHHVCVNALYGSDVDGDPEDLVRFAVEEVREAGHTAIAGTLPLSSDERVVGSTLPVLLLLHAALDGGIVANPALRWNVYTVAEKLCLRPLIQEAAAPELEKAVDEGPCAPPPSLDKYRRRGCESPQLHAVELREVVRLTVAFVAFVVSDEDPAPPGGFANSARPSFVASVLPTLARFPRALARVLLPDLGGWDSPGEGSAAVEAASNATALVGHSSPTHSLGATPPEFVAAFGGQDGRVRRQRFLAAVRASPCLGVAAAHTFGAELTAAMAALAHGHAAAVQQPEPRRSRPERGCSD